MFDTHVVYSLYSGSARSISLKRLCRSVENVGLFSLALKSVPLSLWKQINLIAELRGQYYN
jgi:hypothetical protein